MERKQTARAYRFPPETLAQIRALADYYGLPAAAVLRRVIDEAARRKLGDAAPPGPPAPWARRVNPG